MPESGGALLWTAFAHAAWHQSNTHCQFASGASVGRHGALGPLIHKSLLIGSPLSICAQGFYGDI